MQNKPQIITCPICSEPSTQYELHHIIPISLGGPVDGKQICICNSCHDAVHATAKAMTSKSKKAQNKQYFTDLTHLERASPLIEAIVKAWYMYEGKQSDHRRRRIYILEVSDITHTRLHKLKADKGYTSLDRFLSDMFEAIANGRVKL